MEVENASVSVSFRYEINSHIACITLVRKTYRPTDFSSKYGNMYHGQQAKLGPLETEKPSNLFNMYFGKSLRHYENKSVRHMKLSRKQIAH